MTLITRTLISLRNFSNENSKVKKILTGWNLFGFCDYDVRDGGVHVPSSSGHVRSWRDRQTCPPKSLIKINDQQSSYQKRPGKTDPVEMISCVGSSDCGWCGTSCFLGGGEPGGGLNAARRFWAWTTSVGWSQCDLGLPGAMRST